MLARLLVKSLKGRFEVGLPGRGIFGGVTDRYNRMVVGRMGGSLGWVLLEINIS